MKVIRVIEFADGQECPIAGQYVKTFDFEAYNGVGFGTFTLSLAEAMKFKDLGDAMSFWRTQSRTVPRRADGKPNRPMTACTCEILDIERIPNEVERT